MPTWVLTIRIPYTNNGNTVFTGYAICKVYYPAYSPTDPVGTSTVSVTINPGSSLVVNHTVHTNSSVNIPGTAIIDVETYLQDANGNVYVYKRQSFTLPETNLITSGEIELAQATPML